MSRCWTHCRPHLPFGSYQRSNVKSISNEFEGGLISSLHPRDTASGDIMVLASPPPPTETLGVSTLTLHHLARLTANLTDMFTILNCWKLWQIRKWASPVPLGPLICIICAKFTSLLDLNETWWMCSTIGPDDSSCNFMVIQGHIGGHFGFLHKFFKFVRLVRKLVDVISSRSLQRFEYPWCPRRSCCRAFWIFVQFVKFVRFEQNLVDVISNVPQWMFGCFWGNQRSQWQWIFRHFFFKVCWIQRKLG